MMISRAVTPGHPLKDFLVLTNADGQPVLVRISEIASIRPVLGETVSATVAVIGASMSLAVREKTTEIQALLAREERRAAPWVLQVGALTRWLRS